MSVLAFLIPTAFKLVVINRICVKNFQIQSIVGYFRACWFILCLVNMELFSVRNFLISGLTNCWSSRECSSKFRKRRCGGAIVEWSAADNNEERLLSRLVRSPGAFIGMNRANWIVSPLGDVSLKGGVVLLVLAVTKGTEDEERGGDGGGMVPPSPSCRNWSLPHWNAAHVPQEVTQLTQKPKERLSPL